MVPKLSAIQRLALEMHRRRVKNERKLCRLQQLFWECTLRCNLHCAHCGSDCTKQSNVPEMPWQDFLAVVDDVLENVDCDNLNIAITGGEPLIRTDIEDLGYELAARGLPWGMVSNGMLLDAERFKSLKDAGMKNIAISIDGLASTHNKFRGHRQSFEKATEAIQILAKDGSMNWDVVTCISNQNIGELPELRTLLRNLGVKAWRLFTIFPAGRAKDNDALALSGENFDRLMQFIEAHRRSNQEIDLSYSCEGFLEGYEGKVRDHLFECQAGVNVGSVLCDGTISGCVSIRSNLGQGNVYNERFSEVWKREFKNYRNRDWMRKGKCEHCDLWRYCEGGGMHQHLEEGTLTHCHIR